MNITRLKDLKIGEEAEIIGYEPCDPSYRNKLLSLGLTKATRIRLVQQAPLGDPVEIEVRGFRLSLRKEEADVILLKRVNGSSNAEKEKSASQRGEDQGRSSPQAPPHRKRFRWGLK